MALTSIDKRVPKNTKWRGSDADNEAVHMETVT